MWSLGRVIRNPEVTRVYLGSFWDQPLRYDYFKDLFAVEQMDLFADLRGLPSNSMLRKINDLVRRARVSKAHALLLSYLRKQIPKMFGKAKKQQELLDSMLGLCHDTNLSVRFLERSIGIADKWHEWGINMKPFGDD